MPLDLTSFAVKWQQTQLTEKSAYQQHFRDLCEALGVAHPTEEDIVGTHYTFEKRVTKVGGGTGLAMFGGATRLRGSTSCPVAISTRPTSSSTSTAKTWAIHRC